MDTSTLFKFFISNSLFTFVIIFIGFVLGWVLYTQVVVKNINLRESLFEKDNLAAWVDFMAAFIFPVLYLSAKAIEGSASEYILTDLLICAGYAFVYIVLFTLLRLWGSAVVKLASPADSEGSIDLNKEIYGQKNVAAALFSVSLSIIFTGIIRFLDFHPDLFQPSLFKMGNVLVFSFLALFGYSLLLRFRTSLLKEIFVDNNTAAGVAVAGFVFAVELILGNAVELQRGFNLPDLVALSAVSLAILVIFSFVFKFVFGNIVQTDLWKEVYEQDNIGAAIGQCGLYIGISCVITNFIG